MNSTVEEWRGDFHTFLRAAQACDAPTWTLPYEERRLASHEPRVVKQVTLESSWALIPTHGLWKQLRVFASPHNDFCVTRSQFCDFLTNTGITSPPYQRRVWDLFIGSCAQSVDTAWREPLLNALHFAKTIDVGMGDGAICHRVLRHCFSALPLSRCDQSGDTADEEVLRLTALSSLLAKPNKSGKVPLTTSLTRPQLTALSAYLSDSRFTVVSFTDFAGMFMSSTNPNFGGLFTKQVVEACTQYFREPFGALPHIPPKWRDDVAPLSFNPATPADTDALLLQEVERLGLEHRTPSVNTRGKRAGRKKSDM